MAVEKMKLITVGGRMESLNGFIADCCLDGNVQAEPANNHISSSMGFLPITEDNSYSDRLNIITDMARNFGAELTLLDDSDFVDDTAEYDNEFLDSLSKVIKGLNDEKERLDTEMTSIRQAIENMSHFLEMDIPVNEILACKYIKFRFGHMPKQSLEKLKNFESNPYMVFFPCSYEGEDAWGVYFAPKSRSDEIDQIFSSMYFERLRLESSASTPEKAVEELKEQLAKDEKVMEELEKKAQHVWQKEQKNCNLIYTRTMYGNAVYELRRNAAVLHDNFLFIFWVAENDFKEVEKNLRKAEGIEWEIENAEKLDPSYSPPTKMKNNKLFKPFEEFIRMFGVPNYKEFDPTTVFGVMYTIIFGLMFPDFGQGLVVAVGGFVLGKMKNSDLGKIFFRCGLSAMFFGVVFGSAFGFENAFNWFYALFGMSEKPISVLDSPLGIILMGLYIGVGLIYFFMCLNIYKCVKQKKFGKLLFSESGVAGMIAYTGGVVLVTQFLNKEVHFLPTGVCAGMIAGGLFALFMKEWCVSKIDKEKLEYDGVGDYIITNAVETLEYVISYFTNTLSFLRVGIFVMVHAVMMYVVFTLAPDPGSNIVGFIIVVVLGNILVAALECLLTYIQVLRLGFYEMFSRFYDGDGEEFRAIRLKAKRNQQHTVFNG